MNTIAQELAGYYARPNGSGRLVENMDPLPPSRAEVMGYVATMRMNARRLHAQNWSRLRIAEKLGISPSKVSDYLNK